MKSEVPQETRPAIDPLSLRIAFGCFPSGVTAICAMVDGVPVGMAASSFTSVSLDPPLVLVCMQNVSETWKRLRQACRIGVSVLGEDHARACAQLASKAQADRFDRLDWSATPGGAVLLGGAAMSLDCSVVQEIPAGDHQLVLMRIEDIGFRQDINPLVFHRSRFHRLAPEDARTE